MKKIILQKFLFFSSLMLCFSFITKATLYPFSSSFSGTQEVPVNASPGTGLISGVYNDATNTIFYTLTFSNLLAGTVAAHFHSPGAPGVSAGVIYGYTGFPTGVTSGTYTGSNVITETQETQLKTGLWYANIHSSSFPGGEIRSQITLGPATSLYTFTNTYSGAQENPPTPSTGTGTITGVFDPASHTIFYRVIFSGLLAPTAAAHFHAPALPGVNTAVIYAYTGFPTGVLTGIYSGKNTITALQETQLLAGLWYSNIHTTLYPGGEIRAQIGLQLAAAITCPANIVTGNDAGHCAALVNFAATSAGVPSPALSYTLNNISIVSPYNFPVGTSTVHATATNTTGTAECNFTVTVNDNEAPHITNLTASPSQLWPPNNKMQDVTISYTTTDNCTGAVTCTLSVSSNEPGGSADYIITDEHHLKLRAQRNGNGNGRIYSVT
ncbi:MAG: CHRD domain-containing protein, partial [Ferruginibacter sp.]